MIPTAAKTSLSIGVYIVLMTAALLATVACGCLPGAARAADIAKLKIEFSPDRLGASTSLRTTSSFSNSDGGLPSPVIGFALSLPPQLELVGSTLGLAVCQPAALIERKLGGCSTNAQLGSGSATVAVPFGPETVFETAHITALMGPPVEEDIGVLLYAESLTPVLSRLVFPGKVVVGEGSETLATSFPPVATLPGAAAASTINMTLTVGPEHLTYYKESHGRRVAFHPRGVSLPTKCPKGGFRFLTNIRFLDGTVLAVPYTVPCPPARHGRGA
jgi:hypothetical protein